MSVKFHKKPFYRLDEVCARWAMSHHDLAAFAHEGDLVLAFIAPRMAVSVGEWDKTDEGQSAPIIHGIDYISGLTELTAKDAWDTLRADRHEITQVLAKDNYFVEICTPSGDASSFTVSIGDIVVRHAELERFEKAQGVGPTSTSESVAAAMTTSGRTRGVTPTHDWDAFWVAVCLRLYCHGVPESQAALIRIMQDWFSTTGRGIPDDSTLKKKLKPLWHEVRCDAERKRA